ncbi:MAG: site-specific DNA-methyltransferase, partial [Flavobacteriales bacterium]|nr:site-specific DNA-methyltransferase [Flavobacteriales bacterium]
MSNDNKNSINSDNPLIRVQTTDWNKERLEQLKQLMPDLFTNDGQLNINELKKVVDPKSVNETERYEFRWFGKSNAKREAFTPTNATLVYDEARSVIPSKLELKELKNGQNTEKNSENSANPVNSGPDNFIIEGENLAVLKLLSQSYREQVKCIYIDPPYNTGKDFVYSDNFNQDRKEYWEDAEMTENGFKIDTNTETDGRFHSNWLNMMYSRLLIARQLLKEDGVIFISIDDNEVHHLRKLCDDVFGEENFLGQVSRLTGTPTGQGTRGLVSELDYVVIYSKSDEGDFNGVEFDEEDKQIYNQTDEKGQYLTRPLRKTGGEDKREDRPSMYYPLTAPNNTEIYPVGPGGYESRWRCSLSKYKELEGDGMIEWKEINEDESLVWKPYLKFYLEGRLKQPSDLWKNMDGNKKASIDLKKLLEEKIFDFPKPVEVIKKCALISSDKNDIILDFFAGSGTTGQAITELNQEDGGNRKYILVQLPEATDEKSEAYKAGYKKISDITIERNKRVIENIINSFKSESHKSESSKSESSKSKKANDLRLKANDSSTNDLFTNDLSLTTNDSSTNDLRLKANDSSTNDLRLTTKNLGFKVFKLKKSNFPRVEYAPDPEKSEEENIEALKKYIRDKEAQLVTAFN